MKIYPYYAVKDFLTSYLVCNETCKEALLIDPGKITGDLISRIEDTGYKLAGSCITQLSHCGHGLSTLLKIYDIDVYAGYPVSEHGTVLKGDCTFVIAGFCVECFSVVGYFGQSYLFKIENCVFTGGCRVEEEAMLQKREAQSLATQLKKKLTCYGDELILFPGLGPPSTLGAARQFMSW